MNKSKLIVAILTGLAFGGVFAEGPRPLSVSNTLRFGYDDNIYRTRGARKDSGFFIEDVVDLGYRASLSARTDFMVKSRIVLLSDKDNELYPNLFVMMNHAATPRLLLNVSDTFTTGDKNGNFNPAVGNRRYNYWRNRVGLSADYVLTEKDRLGASGAYTIERNQKEADIYDYNRYDTGLSWSRELLPMRTKLILAWNHAGVEYANMQPKHSFDSDSFYAEVKHTFNPEWIGHIRGGATYVNRDFIESSRTVSPLFGAGLAYVPTPRTRVTADYDYRYEQTDNALFGGQTESEWRFGVEHEMTARIIVKSAVRFKNAEYDRRDRVTGAMVGGEDERFDWDTRVSYRINRMHFVEAGYRYARRESDTIGDWEQNRVDVGWRVQF